MVDTIIVGRFIGKEIAGRLMIASLFLWWRKSEDAQTKDLPQTSMAHSQGG